MFWFYAFLLIISLKEMKGFKKGPPINKDVCSSMTPGHESKSIQINPQSTANTKLQLNTSFACYAPGGPAIVGEFMSFENNILMIIG